MMLIGTALCWIAAYWLSWGSASSLIDKLFATFLAALGLDFGFF